MGQIMAMLEIISEGVTTSLRKQSITAVSVSATHANDVYSAYTLYVWCGSVTNPWSYTCATQEAAAETYKAIMQALKIDHDTQVVI